MRYRAALVLAAVCLAPAPALAQFSWGQPFERSAFQSLPVTATGHWRACINDEQRYESAEVTEGCTRLLENRLSEEERALALWWRAVGYGAAAKPIAPLPTSKQRSRLIRCGRNRMIA